MAGEKDRFCAHCATVIQQDDVFCNNCGASLDGTLETITSAPVQQDPFAQPIDSHQEAVHAPPKKTQFKLDSVALAFGIITIVLTASLPPQIYFMLVPGAVAVITGIFAIKMSQNKTYAIIGIVLGFAGIFFWVLGFFDIFRIDMLW